MTVITVVMTSVLLVTHVCDLSVVTVTGYSDLDAQ